jgi:hypothetical protein
MPHYEEKFDRRRIESIKRYLQREADKGREKDFEIIIDGFKVVSRTNNIDEFDDYEQELREDSRHISFLVYDGPDTNRNNRYTFMMGTNPTTAQPPVATLGEIDQVVAQKIEEKEREHELQHLKEKLSSTKEQLEEAEEYAQQLEKQIEDMKQKRYANAVSLGELATVVVKTLVRENAAKIPGGQALAGWLGADVSEAATAQQLTDQPTATYQPKQETSGDLPEETRNRLSLIEQMQQKFSEQQMIAVFTVLNPLEPARNGIIEAVDFFASRGIERARGREGVNEPG